MSSHVIEGVKEIIADVANIDAVDIGVHDNLYNDLGLDEMDIMEIMLVAEEVFNLSENLQDDVDNIETVHDVIDYVNERV